MADELKNIRTGGGSKAKANVNPTFASARFVSDYNNARIIVDASASRASPNQPIPAPTTTTTKPAAPTGLTTKP
jgi:hypothetical protein